MNDDLIAIWLLYTLVAACVSIPVAFNLENRLKVRLPHTKPYKWGFYIGCMNLAVTPLALLSFMALFTVSTSDAVLGALIMAVYFSIHAVSGWFIIKRRRWALIVGTILQCNLFSWVINGIYLSRRWEELTEETGGFPSSVVAHSGASNPAVPPPLPTEVSNNSLFFLAVRGKRQGPYTRSQIRSMWDSGQVPANTQYWSHGMTTWYPLIDLLERNTT